MKWIIKFLNPPTVWGGRLRKRFCNMFSDSSTGSWAELQLPCCPSKQGELPENILQNLFLNRPPQTVDDMSCWFFWFLALNEIYNYILLFTKPLSAGPMTTSRSGALPSTTRNTRCASRAPAPTPGRRHSRTSFSNTRLVGQVWYVSHCLIPTEWPIWSRNAVCWHPIKSSVSV